MDEVERFLKRKIYLAKRKLAKLKTMEGKTKNIRETAKLSVALLSCDNELTAYAEELNKRYKG